MKRQTSQQTTSKYYAAATVKLILYKRDDNHILYFNNNNFTLLGKFNENNELLEVKYRYFKRAIKNLKLNK